MEDLRVIVGRDVVTKGLGMMSRNLVYRTRGSFDVFCKL